MGVVIRQRQGAWWVFINHQGRRKAKRVGTGPSGKKAAELAAMQMQAQLALGRYEPLADSTCQACCDV